MTEATGAGDDLIERLRDPSTRCCHAEIFEQAADEIERLEAQVEYLSTFLAENERLRVAIKTQANAVRTLQRCEDTEINRLRKTHQQAHVATQTLDSEREANAVLTAENDRLRAALETAQAEMREECAAVCEELASAVFHPTQTITDRCAAAIRALPLARAASPAPTEGE